jgi:hypothetical protein
MPLIKFNLITADGNYVMLFIIILYKFYLAEISYFNVIECP